MGVGTLQAKPVSQVTLSLLLQCSAPHAAANDGGKVRIDRSIGHLDFGLQDDRDLYLHKPTSFL